jgi:hypothetical protein
MMLSKTHSMIAGLVLAVGCHLEDDTKNACTLAEDCLPGYQCVNATCIGGGSNNTTSPDAPSGAYYGTVEPLTAQSAGVTGSGNYETLVAVTTAPGTLGCAVVGDLQASPGEAAVVYAKVSGQTSDTRCPNGVFAIVNDPSACRQSWPDELRAGCAIYKRWDASGKQVAYQLATGGYVSLQQTYLNDQAYRCSAEVSIRFAGGATVSKSFTFDYNPLGSTSAFCKH